MLQLDTNLTWKKKRKKGLNKHTHTHKMEILIVANTSNSFTATVYKISLQYIQDSYKLHMRLANSTRALFLD